MRHFILVALCLFIIGCEPPTPTPDPVPDPTPAPEPPNPGPLPPPDAVDPVDVPIPSGAIYVSPSGSDNNPGTSSQPVRSIGRAANIISGGGTIVIRSGTYNDDFEDVFPAGSSWSNATHVQAEEGASVTLRPSGGTNAVEFSSSSQRYIILEGVRIDGSGVSKDSIKITNSSHHIRIKDCEVYGAPNQGIAISNGSDYNEISGCDIHDNGSNDGDHGIYIRGDHNLVEDCDIYANEGWAVHVYSDSHDPSDNMIRRNLCHDNAKSGQDGVGIGLYSGDRNRAENNICWNNEDGISVGYDARDTVVVHNTCFDNNYAGIRLSSASNGATVANNIAWSNGVNYQDSGGSQEAGNLFGTDPKFETNGRDGKLKANSPAIDHGSGGYSQEYGKEDFYGTGRPHGPAPDAGAYEYPILLPADATSSTSSILPYGTGS